MRKRKNHFMTNMITKPIVREIIQDFASEIKKRKRTGVKPSFEVIFFREEHRKNIERPVYEVPIELLRFRKDNGRIASDIIGYEKNYGPLLEKSDDAQAVIREYLEKKDPPKTIELINSIKHSSQRNAAIITADGFLINGNRRKVAIEKLWEETKDERYHWMKVVILPGVDDEGGPPTIKEVEQIENRYQLQSEGKSEYYNFDRALSIRRKIDLGMTLEEQLRDDPNFVKLPQKEFIKVVRKYEDEFIKPLECIDRYLEQLVREGLYYTISTGISDREGRWQAFLDYYNHVKTKLDDEYKRNKYTIIKEDETGEAEEIAFKIIRKREFKDLPKVHKIMRDLPKWFNNEESKKELFNLLEINNELPYDDCYDEDGNEYDERKKDQIWSAKHSTKLHRHVKNAQRIVEHERERETPITLMDAAIKKLEHENMDLTSIEILENYKLVREKLVKIQEIACNLESEWYNLKKNINKLKDKFGK